jgi:hypothetical protein
MTRVILSKGTHGTRSEHRDFATWGFEQGAHRELAKREITTRLKVGPTIAARGHMEGRAKRKVSTCLLVGDQVSGMHRGLWMQNRSSRPSELVDFAISGVRMLGPR